MGRAYLLLSMQMRQMQQPDFMMFKSGSKDKNLVSLSFCPLLTYSNISSVVLAIMAPVDLVRSGV